jgi:TonB family protein
MNDSWKNWEGQVADAQFHLRRHLGGTDRTAVFLTEFGEGEPHQAAIKLIPADPDTAETQLSRWRQAAKLSHANLVRIFQAGRCRLGDRNMLYVVTEYAAEDLSQILPRRPLTAAETRDMLAPILDALAYLQSNGFVHGRVKPSNIMAVEEQLKISSDGLCRAGRPNGARVKPGPYDAPEFSNGAASPSGDVWALGMTVVEGLTQRLPVWEHLRDDEPSLPENLPAEFHDLARQCLHRDPVRRWTVADIGRWLQPAAPMPAIPEWREPAPHSATAPAKTSNRRYLIPIAAMVLLLVAMLAGPKIFTRHTDAEPAAPAPATNAQTSRADLQPASQPKPTASESQPPATTPPATKSEPAATPPAPAPANSAPAPVATNAAPVKGEVAEQVVPDISAKARSSIEGKVRVSVRVHADPSGKVVGATFDSYGPSKFFAEKAHEAALRWKFFPPTVNGQNVASDWLLHFEFTNSGATVHPAQVGQ